MGHRTPPASRPLDSSRRLRVGIELTNVCNFRCPICPQAHRGPAGGRDRAPYERKRGYMRPDVFQRAIEECRCVAGSVSLGFFGEQTLHPRYVEHLRAMRHREFTLEVSSNIAMCTREIMQAWIDVGVNLVRLSLDAITPEVINRARPGTVRDFAGRIVSEAERMQVLNDKVNHWLALPDHRPTRLVFVKSSHNLGEAERFVRYWAPRLGRGDRILLKQVLTYGGKIQDALVERHQCRIRALRFLMIDWQGNMSPCNLDTNMDLTLGNIMDESIEAAYLGPRGRALRARTGCGQDITPCRTCVDANNWSRNEVYTNPRHGRSRPFMNNPG